SVAFWWYCNNGVTNILAGIALFEVFHDVQYLSLVWIYNRNRVEKDRSIGGFMRFIFRRSGSLIGLYIGLVFAYGSIGYLNSSIGIETITRVLTGVVAASGLLHFYYDGFIWKVREKSTRQSLGLTGGTVHVNLALVLVSKSKLDEAKKYYERAVQLDPSAGEVRSGYAYLLERLGRADEARAEYENAIRLSPKSARLFYTYAAFLDKKGELDAAIAQYQRALQVDPNLADAHSELATALFTKGDLPRAEAHYLEAARLDPKRADIHSNFGSLLLREGKTSQAILQYEEALRLDPKLTEAEENLRVARASDIRFK